MRSLCFVSSQLVYFVTLTFRLYTIKSWPAHFLNQYAYIAYICEAQLQKYIYYMIYFFYDGRAFRVISEPERFTSKGRRFATEKDLAFPVLHVWGSGNWN